MRERIENIVYDYADIMGYMVKDLDVIKMGSHYYYTVWFKIDNKDIVTMHHVLESDDDMKIEGELYFDIKNKIKIYNYYHSKRGGNHA